MEWIKPDINIDFVRRFRIALGVSAVLIVLTVLALLFLGGPALGVDFSGGFLVQVKFSKPTTIAQVKEALAGVGLGETTVQDFIGENEFLLRMQDSGKAGGNVGRLVSDGLTQVFGKDAFEIQRVEYVGPKVGKELQRKGVLALFYAMIGLLVYISWRFESLKFAFGAIAALLHDVILTVGAFTITGREFSLPIIAALLAIVGYSLNDTIVLFDRVRENHRRGGSGSRDMPSVINRSVNEVLSRTVLTSFTTLITVVVLFIFGGGVIHDFAFALIVGVFVGTYSSVFIASPVVLWWERFAVARK